MKDAIFLASSKADLRAFPEIARSAVGMELWQVQCGFPPSDWKPMPNIGPGVCELRIHAGGAFRILYLATRPEAIYVLHCFEKKSRKSRDNHLHLARQRLKTLEG
jgi:phage-related protein